MVSTGSSELTEPEVDGLYDVYDHQPADLYKLIVNLEELFSF